MYKISVIIPTYNVEKYIDECFDSLINQTFKDFEIIVVDDGSTDSTGYMIERYAEIFKNIRIIKQKNSGSAGGPRNRGIEVSRGEYLFFLDPDDVLPYNSLELLYEAVRRSNSEIVCGNFLRFNSKKAWSVKHVSEKIFFEERVVKFEEAPELLNNIITCNKLYSADFIKKNNIRYHEEIRYGEDRVFMLDAYTKADKIHIIPQIIYKYRGREDKNNVSATQDLSLYIFKQSIQAVLLNYKAIQEQKVDKIYVGLFSKERVQYDFLRFINYYTKIYDTEEQWNDIFDICGELASIINEKNQKLSYYQRVKIYNIKNRNYKELIHICEKERSKYYYSINKKNNTWITEEKKYNNIEKVCRLNTNDLDLRYKIENISVNEEKLEIRGWAYLNRVNIRKRDDIKKYIIFKGINGEEVKELDLFSRNDVNIKNGKFIFSYKYCGINGSFNIYDLKNIVNEEYPEVKIYLKLMLSDNLYKEVYIESLEIFNYINKIYNKIIQRIDRVYLEEQGIRILGWAGILYLNNNEKEKYPKRLVIKNKDNREEKIKYANNKLNKWYNNSFESNPYSFNYEFSGWECTIPYEELEAGRYELYIEIKLGEDWIREKLQYGSFILLKNRLNFEKTIINYMRRFKLELTTSEYTRRYCNMELYVSDIKNPNNQLMGGYIPIIGRRMANWDSECDELQLVLDRIKVSDNEFIIEGSYNNNLFSVNELYVNIEDENKKNKKVYKITSIDEIYNKKIINGWQVAIPYNEIHEFSYAKISIKSGKNFISNFRFSNRLKNNRGVWDKTHYIKSVKLNIYKKEIINSEDFELHLGINVGVKFYIEGIIIKLGNRFKKVINRLMKVIPYRNKFRIKPRLNKIYPYIYSTLTLLPRYKHKVVMLGYQENINANFKPLYNKLYNEHKELKVKYIGGNEKTKVEIIKLLYNMATAKTIVLNDYYRYIYNLNISKRTKVIQIWHATGIFKKFGFLALGKNDSNKEEFELNAHRSYTDVIVSSEYVRKPYAEAFRLPIGNIQALGVPRTDVFFDEKYISSCRKKLFEQFPCFEGKKLILYAPTFRGNANERKSFRNQISFKKLEKLKELGYLVLIKLHPVVQEKFEVPINMKEFIYDMTRYPDINELFCISHILITDYSSNMFEFALLNKPILLFAYDLEKYLLERGFYDDYEEMVPGPICKTTEELVDNILNIDKNPLDYSEFRRKYLEKCDGKSTERVVDLIINN